MDRGTWWATGHGVAKSRTQLSDFTHTHTHTHTQVRNYSVVNEDSGASCFDPEMSEC